MNGQIVSVHGAHSMSSKECLRNSTISTDLGFVSFSITSSMAFRKSGIRTFTPFKSNWNNFVEFAKILDKT